MNTQSPPSSSCFNGIHEASGASQSVKMDPFFMAWLSGFVSNRKPYLNCTILNYIEVTLVFLGEECANSPSRGLRGSMNLVTQNEGTVSFSSPYSKWGTPLLLSNPLSHFVEEKCMEKCPLWTTCLRKLTVGVKKTV